MPASRRLSAAATRSFPPPDPCGYVLRCTKGFANRTSLVKINVRTLYQLFTPRVLYARLGLKKKKIVVHVYTHEYQPRPLFLQVHAACSAYFVRDVGNRDYLQSPSIRLTLVPVLMILICTAVPTHLNIGMIKISLVQS